MSDPPPTPTTLPTPTTIFPKPAVLPAITTLPSTINLPTSSQFNPPSLVSSLPNQKPYSLARKSAKTSEAKPTTDELSSEPKFLTSEQSKPTLVTTPHAFQDDQ
ncbi:unnamed protein product [Nezara viridula]|uniref:Uncharacterized protein n=1 Tax=Nezara viridula TaxID=85310 RepID=A0A9P0EAJ7_NEZVI|nr:unnamed protein product [Nezara viridula]